MVIFEAAREITEISGVTSRELTPAITVLQMFLSSSKPVLCFAVVRTLNKLAKPTSRREVTKKKKKDSVEVRTENLVPENWNQFQKDINITKKEKRRLARDLEFGRRVERSRLGLKPIGEDGRASAAVVELSRVVDEKLKKLKMIILDNPVFPEAGEEGDCEKSDEEVSVSSVSNSRVFPIGLCLYSGRDIRTYELLKLLKQQ